MKPILIEEYDLMLAGTQYLDKRYIVRKGNQQSRVYLGKRLL